MNESNLIPFKTGYDSRRVIPNTKGMKYEHSSAFILKQLLSEEATIGGRKATQFDAMLYTLITDALAKDKQTGLMLRDPVDRHRAINIILDRLEGKPLQRGELKHTGSVEIVGRLLADYSDEEFIDVEQGIREGKLLVRGDRVVEATFEDAGSTNVPPENVQNFVQTDSESGDRQTNKNIRN